MGRTGRGAQLETLLQILGLFLRSRTGITLQEIAAEIDQTERSARRYLADCSAALPIEEVWGSDRRKRWRLMPDHGLPTLQLQLDEALALARLRSLVITQAPAPWRRTLAELMERIEGEVPPKLRTAMDELLQRFGAAPTHGEARVTDEVVQQFERAARDCRRLVVRYRSLSTPRKRPRDRHFDPYVMFVAERAVYAHGYDGLNHECRTLALDRVESVLPTNLTFTRPEEFTPEAFLVTLHRAHGGQPVDVVVRAHGAAARLLVERPEVADQKATPLETGGVEVRFSAPISPALVSRILSFGPEVEVVQPKRLRAQVAKRLREAADKYGDTEDNSKQEPAASPRNQPKKLESGRRSGPNRSTSSPTIPDADEA